MKQLISIVLHQLRTFVFDPLFIGGVALLAFGQEIGWRLGDLSIDSPQSVSLSVIYAVMHLVSGMIAVAFGCRLWRMSKYDGSIVLEWIPPGSVTMCFIGRALGLLATLTLFTGLCMAVAWRPTLGPVAEMRPAFVALGLEQFVLGAAAAFFAALFGPLLGALFAFLFWVISLVLPLVIEYLVNQYSPIRDLLTKLSHLISLQRLQVVDPYSIGEGAAATVDWQSLSCYTASAAGFFLVLSFLVLLRRGPISLTKTVTKIVTNV